MATKITIETDDRRFLSSVESLLHHGIREVSGQLDSLLAELRSNRALLVQILRKENQIIMANQQIAEDLDDAVEALMDNEAALEERVNAAITLLSANPDAAHVQAAVAKLKGLDTSQDTFRDTLPGGTPAASSPAGATTPASAASDSTGASTGASEATGSTPPAGDADTSAAPSGDTTPPANTEGQ